MSVLDIQCFLDLETVLGIETSCDDTGAAIYAKSGLLAHVYDTQYAMHARYGGIIPEVTSRDHIKKLAPLVEVLLNRTHLKIENINGIAYTAGPGLPGALMVGAAFARSLAFARNLPVVAVHHLEGHLFSPFLTQALIEFPFLGLLVSGGHTLLISVLGLGKYKILGSTLDDAAGEAFDKTARLMGIDYPGGAMLSKLAEEGDPDAFPLPRPLIKDPSFNFSFSGLKTAVSNLVRKDPEILIRAKADLAASFQAAVIDCLIKKTQQALQFTGYKKLVVAGGVSANLPLRARLSTLGVECFYPDLEFCTDNAAMIAYVGYLRLISGEFTESLSFAVKPKWDLSLLNSSSK